MRISFLQSDDNLKNCINFQGKTETFWKVYNSRLEGVPLRDVIIRSINNEANLLGEGFTKKGFKIEGLKEYIIRIYKNSFKTEDIDAGFSKPKNNFLNTVDSVVLSIPEKIDIVKTKFGDMLGVDEYGIKMCPPMANVQISREETLRLLNIYDKLKDFPLKSFRQAYKQMKLFNRKPGYQFDILNPNNILIDTEKQKINFIDPMDPKINKCTKNNMIDFSAYHGCDSIYPVLCDFLMQKEHLANLTVKEHKQWENAVRTIILKCINAGKEAGFKRNRDEMKQLFHRVDNLWSGGQRVVEARYDNFVKQYSDVISLPDLSEQALNYKIPEKLRIDAIRQFNVLDFKDLLPIFEKIEEAPHQPKVELPEVLNAVLDKVKEYGSEAKSFIPVMEKLLGKEIFYTTKRRIYDLFINLQPGNKIFLDCIEKSSLNSVEKTLYEEQIFNLYVNSRKLKPRFQEMVRQIFKNSLGGEKVKKDLVEKIWISRTCTNTGEEQSAALNGILNAYQYIETIKDRIPKSSDLTELHKILMENAPRQEKIIGKIRTPETDHYFAQIFNIKKDIKKTVNPYYESKDIPQGLAELDEYINENYYSMDVHLLASNIFSKIVNIHPFYNGNGRAARLFTEQFLLSKGLRLTKWPEETLYRKICSPKELAEKLKECTVKIKKK